jgi:predicted dehydrogenase
VRTAETLEDVELAGVVTRGSAPGARRLGEILLDATVDAVCVCTPNLLHAELVGRVLEAAKHVVVEYPLAATPAEARDLFRAARERDRVLHVEHIELLSASQEAQRQQVVRLGRLIEGTLQFRAAGGKWILDASLAGSPALRALARLHRLVDLFGEAQVERADLVDRAEAGYTLEVEFSFRAGGRARLVEERAPNAARLAEWDLVCEKGHLGSPPTAPPGALFERDLEHFVRRVREGIPPYVTEERVLHVLELVRQIDERTG